MCGIAGAFGPQALSPERISRTLSLMARRGPDGRGTWCGRIGDSHLDLLHTRLSIQDLDSRSDQPFIRDDLVLVFNGEIYNFPELRKELEGLGHQFVTSGDTEVILAAYQQWGADCTDRFEGMWAFALYDGARGLLFLSRDRFGEKPLYTWFDGGRLYFGSEVRFLAGMAGRKPDVNYEQLRRYLVNGYKALYPAGQTFFRDVSEFPAGASAMITIPEKPKARAYWQLDYAPVEMSATEALEGAAERVEAAVGLRLRADVPVALRLSGGIDSNVALGIARQRFNRDITTFSVIEEDERYDETAAILASIKRQGCPHHLIDIPKQGFWDRLTGLIDYFGQPMMTISYYLHALASEEMQKQGFKVSLGGTGADEIFSGYYDHYLFWLAEMREREDFEQLVEGWRNTYGRFVRNPFLQDPRAFIDAPGNRDHIFLQTDRFSDFLTEPFAEAHRETVYTDQAILRNRMMNELLSETVPVMLHEDDLSAMAYSVENRATYLDSGLVEFLFSVPSRHLVQNSLPKYLLRETGRGMVDEDILENPRKQGINAPVTSFLDFHTAEARDLLLADSPLFDVIDRGKLAGLAASEVALNSESKFLFSIISAKLFLETHHAFQP
ncbi:asparagine synthase (glutamine-hydrolyzing) [Aestuariispira insulae]|uniref:asparagine synthase (glutamine-hydrolyzing) n=1 Tax=Aestuariispira insulae TaxID=1461337 RepID=A0A3D9HSK7_9PROT|nr:asparagine synthase (glutamine-hydrolyzing) [Aestuariispira insulae]RED52440.1 asparagine synthase (glutamine-hydrolysing) [Aestuariispira insulae]